MHFFTQDHFKRFNLDPSFSSERLTSISFSLLLGTELQLSGNLLSSWGPAKRPSSSDYPHRALEAVQPGVRPSGPYLDLVSGWLHARAAHPSWASVSLSAEPGARRPGNHGTKSAGSFCDVLADNVMLHSQRHLLTFSRCL